jgi:hypothetical protein
LYSKLIALERGRQDGKVTPKNYSDQRERLLGQLVQLSRRDA